MIGSPEQGGIDLSCAKQRTHPWPQTQSGAILVKTGVTLTNLKHFLTDDGDFRDDQHEAASPRLSRGRIDMTITTVMAVVR